MDFDQWTRVQQSQAILECQQARARATYHMLTFFDRARTMLATVWRDTSVSHGRTRALCRNLEASCRQLVAVANVVAEKGEAEREREKKEAPERPQRPRLFPRDARPRMRGIPDEGGGGGGNGGGGDGGGEDNPGFLGLEDMAERLSDLIHGAFVGGNDGGDNQGDGNGGGEGLAAMLFHDHLLKDLQRDLLTNALHHQQVELDDFYTRWPQYGRSVSKNEAVYRDVRARLAVYAPEFMDRPMGALYAMPYLMPDAFLRNLLYNRPREANVPPVDVDEEIQRPINMGGLNVHQFPMLMDAIAYGCAFQVRA